MDASTPNNSPTSAFSFYALLPVFPQRGPLHCQCSTIGSHNQACRLSDLTACCTPYFVEGHTLCNYFLRKYSFKKVETLLQTTNLSHHPFAAETRTKHFFKSFPSPNSIVSSIHCKRFSNVFSSRLKFSFLTRPPDPAQIFKLYTHTLQTPL